jgi:hypothetical protein
MISIDLLPSGAYIQRSRTLRLKQEDTGNTASTEFITKGLFKALFKSNGEDYRNSKKEIKEPGSGSINLGQLSQQMTC